MSQIDLGYGDQSVKFTFDDRLKILSVDPAKEKPLSDVEIGNALDSPISSPPLDELINADDSVLLVVSDATRPTGSAQIVNLVVRRLIQSGVAASNVAIVFATGIHRAVTAQEKIELLTPFIVQRIRTLAHDAYDRDALVSLGTTVSGIPVEVNKALTEFSKTILFGGINFHYFAGFTGGRKSICPGLASAETIKRTHMLALDFERGARKAGVGASLLDGNAVHEECERVAQLVNPTFGINTVVDELKRAVRIHCGDWRLAHRAACDSYLDDQSIAIEGKGDLVIVSCGGFPHDINLIQAHKALEMASYACKEGGSIILLAECRDGLGRPDFLKWFDSPNSVTLAKRLVEEYEVNGQTAWSLLTKAERFDIQLVSGLQANDVERMGMRPARDLEEAMNHSAHYEGGFVMPRGAAVLPFINFLSKPMKLIMPACVVRDWVRHDRDSLVHHANNRKVWINLRDRFPYPYTTEDASRWLDCVIELAPATNFAIDVNGEAIGGIGFSIQADVCYRSAEVGYWVGEAFWGRGIATQALVATSEYAFASYDLCRLYAHVFEWNLASAQVLEKAGYKFEGRLVKSVPKDGKTIDQLLYAKTID